MSEYYTQEERKGMAKVLRGARGKIENRKEIFVCCAVAAIGKETPIVGRYAILAESYIDELLDGSYTLNQWLDIKYGIPFKCEGLEISQYREKMRATRLAWIDNMIKELS